MRLRRHRRNLVVWSQSAGSVGRYGAPRFTAPSRTRRIRRFLRTGVLLTIVNLMPLAIGARARWRMVLPAGAVEFARSALEPLPAGQVRNPRVFAAEKPAPAGASDSRAFLAWTGRDPDWTPSA